MAWRQRRRGTVFLRDSQALQSFFKINMTSEGRKGQSAEGTGESFTLKTP
jgi:hypothetical protein